MGTTREALEAALAAEPESVALHSAYADLLIEEGDPRGEYIRLELMLEDSGLNVKQRRSLKQKAESILKANEREWLGPLYQYVNSQLYSQHAELKWVRGWIESISFLSMYLFNLDDLRHCPVIRMLRGISLCYTIPMSDHGSRVDKNYDSLLMALERMPLLRFSIFGIVNGDEAVEALVKCRFFSGLTHLQMKECSMTDDGARLLADHPHISKLKHLDLRDNYLSPIGIATLEELGLSISRSQRGNPAWEDDRHNTGWGADAV